MKKLLSTIILFAILISCCSMFAYADSDVADNVRFVPTHIEITSSEIEVEGFFVNMNRSYEVGNFSNLDLSVYIDDTEVCSGIFSSVNQFMMPPMSVYFQSFTFSNEYGSKLNGSYDCDDTCYAVFGGNFSNARSSSIGGSTYYAGAANTDIGDLVRFIPTNIEVSTSKTVVEGYFVNLSYNKAVSDFTDFEMDVFVKGRKVIGGNFGDINSFTVSPLGMKYQSFTFNDDYTDELDIGSYVCSDDVYASFGSSFYIENA